MASSKDRLEVLDWRQLPYQIIAGVDEAGRGCLAGPVYASAVILDPARTIEGIRDSKIMTPKARTKVAELIRQECVAWAVAVATVEEIEKLNILHASMLAMRRAVEALKSQPQLVLVDGNYLPKTGLREQAVVNGDFRCEVIGAASILAKCARDEFMSEQEARYPGYGFALHKGYGTPLHRDAIKRLGPTILHRRSFAGVAEYCL